MKHSAGLPLHFYEGGPAVNCGSAEPPSGPPDRSGISSGAQLSIASSGEDRADGNLAPVAQIICGPSGGQCDGGAFGSEGLTASEHVPDRVREAARELDLGDPGPRWRPSRRLVRS